MFDDVVNMILLTEACPCFKDDRALFYLHNNKLQHQVKENSHNKTSKHMELRSFTFSYGNVNDLLGFG